MRKIIKKFFNFRFNSGLTLPELLVTVSIMSLIGAVSLASYPKFRDRVELKKTVQEIAKVIRQSVVYGRMGVVEEKTSKAPPYGVHFDIQSPNSFVLFAKTDNFGAYDADNDELVENPSLPSGYFISGLQEDGANIDSGILDIIYEIATPVACINATEIPCSDGGSEASIIVSSPTGETKTLVVGAGGQTSVE